MKIEVRAPALPESIADATVAAWHRQAGEPIHRDENLVDLETDKVVLEVPAPANGTLVELHQPTGAIVTAGELLAVIDTEAEPPPAAAAEPSPPTEATAAIAPSPAVAAPTPPAVSPAPAAPALLSPSMRRRLFEREQPETKPTSVSAQPAPAARAPAPAPAPAARPTERGERREPVSRLRARIAERLLAVQQNTASLTTFNEVNLQQVTELRQRHREAFEKKHGVRLGFMSFFVKAVVESLRRFPVVNASLDGNEIVYHDYYDIGIAVSTDRGLVVPILRDADRLGFGEIDRQIGEFARKARDGKLSYEELAGGTFSITNGGVFGSLMSTPLLNPPQSGILGMHAIKERPVIEDGQMVVRPMMYLALTYDHRLIDGRDAVQFLVSVRDLLEDPARLLLDV